MDRRRWESPVKLLRVMGCDSVQYGSMERYLVRLTRRAAERGHRSVIVYDSQPRVPQFVTDVRKAGGELLSLERAPGEPWRVATARMDFITLGFQQRREQCIETRDANLGNIFVFLRRITADPYRTDYFAFISQRQSALQGRGTR